MRCALRISCWWLMAAVASALSAAAWAQPQPAVCCAPSTPAVPRVAAGADVQPADAPSREGMVWVPGGTFTMGGDDGFAQPHERPLHRVRIDGFWIDATEVTNAQFRAFVEATGYVTVAERAIDWEQIKKQVPPGTPKPPDEMLRPASLVFNPPPPEAQVDYSNYHVWWKLVPGASWRAPRGPGSDIDGLDDHPVVQVCWEDAAAYAAWAGKQLPTEAQWELAARGGGDAVHTTNVWGDDPAHPTKANYWQGKFPRQNTAEDGYVYTNPVKAFAPNALGLYGMAGNVWEWCADRYRVDAYARRVHAAGPDAVIENPTGPTRSFDPRNPHAPELRAQRGGSFLCNDAYCANYRPSSREAATPDSAMNHLGFRTVLIAPGPAQKPEAKTTAREPSHSGGGSEADPAVAHSF
ncbi:MAG: formylglycine-generating enzyme family protein [Planctomycetota bacterium]